MIWDDIYVYGLTCCMPRYSRYADMPSPMESEIAAIREVISDLEYSGRVLTRRETDSVRQRVNNFLYAVRVADDAIRERASEDDNHTSEVAMRSAEIHALSKQVVSTMGAMARCNMELRDIAAMTGMSVVEADE